MSALSRTQTVSKHVIETPGGVVAAQHRLAAEAGAEKGSEKESQDT